MEPLVQLQNVSAPSSACKGGVDDSLLISTRYPEDLQRPISSGHTIDLNEYHFPDTPNGHAYHPRSREWTEFQRTYTPTSIHPFFDQSYALPLHHHHQRPSSSRSSIVSHRIIPDLSPSLNLDHLHPTSSSQPQDSRSSSSCSTPDFDPQTVTPYSSQHPSQTIKHESKLSPKDEEVEHPSHLHLHHELHHPDISQPTYESLSYPQTIPDDRITDETGDEADSQTHLDQHHPSSTPQFKPNGKKSSSAKISEVRTSHSLLLIIFLDSLHHGFQHVVFFLYICIYQKRRQQNRAAQRAMRERRKVSDGSDRHFFHLSDGFHSSLFLIFSSHPNLREPLNIRRFT